MNHTQELQQRVDPAGTQVFMLTCPASIPANFAAHQWFVINRFGALSRWEVLHRNIKDSTRWGHLYLNRFPPFEGLEIFLPTRRFLWSARLLGVIDGDAAQRAAGFIERSPSEYPYCYTYSFTGPNSNTYSQWVLDHTPEFGVELPWNAFGKDYPIIRK
jgi:hypothetical protein